MSSPEKLPLSSLSRGDLEALIERLLAANAALKRTMADLRAEVAQLKGVKGKPAIKPAAKPAAKPSGMEAGGGWGAAGGRAAGAPPRAGGHGQRGGGLRGPRPFRPRAGGLALQGWLFPGFGVVKAEA